LILNQIKKKFLLMAIRPSQKYWQGLILNQIKKKFLLMAIRPSQKYWQGLVTQTSYLKKNLIKSCQTQPNILA
jgi:hypothetical protein